MSASPYPTIEMLIDGQWTQGSGSERQDVINPATDEVLGQVPHATAADLDRALEATKKGFKAWSSKTPAARQIIMNKAADLIAERRNAIAELLTMEMGKPLGEAKTEIDFVVDVTRWAGEEGKRAYGRVIPASVAGPSYTVVNEPVGPACAFTAWNFPGSNVIRKIGHALGAGCSILIKPSEETPATAVEIAKAYQEAGVPDGTVQIVFGVPDTISRHIIGSGIPKKLSFTGSVPVGKHLAALAAGQMMRNTMELGGHAPVLITEDADLDKAIKMSGGFKFRNAGQVCISPTRFLVDKKVHADFIDGITSLASKVPVGNGLERGISMGPLIAERQVERMERLVQDAKDKGAEVTTGGERVGNQGSFYAPTVLTGATDEMDMMNEEPFGPVAPISVVDNLDEMIHRANRLSVGLAGYAFTSDGKTADRLSREVQVGMLGINTTAISLAETPFGGVDESGYGHEGGIEGLQAYQRTRLVVEAR
ncbi:MAG: NAD-dependent succinate-semialdehyde dehydrogenase [Pseudomonadota bacterium]